MRRPLPRILLAFATAAATTTVLAQAPAAAPASAQKLVMIATGSLVGIYHPAGGAVCRLVNRDRKRHGLRCSVDSTDGSGANIEALRDGSYEMGIVQSDVAWIASRGEGAYAQWRAFNPELAREVLNDITPLITLLTTTLLVIGIVKGFSN